MTVGDRPTGGKYTSMAALSHHPFMSLEPMCLETDCVPQHPLENRHFSCEDL